MPTLSTSNTEETSVQSSISSQTQISLNGDQVSDHDHSIAGEVAGIVRNTASNANLALRYSGQVVPALLRPINQGAIALQGSVANIFKNVKL